MASLFLGSSRICGEGRISETKHDLHGRGHRFSSPSIFVHRRLTGLLPNLFGALRSKNTALRRSASPPSPASWLKSFFISQDEGHARLGFVSFSHPDGICH
jgi:hypothetical protein